eukprot:2506681-Alexandrium_andersonii.AAC.1
MQLLALLGEPLAGPSRLRAFILGIYLELDPRSALTLQHCPPLQLPAQVSHASEFGHFAVLDGTCWIWWRLVCGEWGTGSYGLHWQRGKGT